MKKILTISAFIVLVIKVIDDIFFDLQIAMLSNETVTYKLGFIFGFLLLLLCIAGLSLQIYEIFFTNRSNKSPSVQ